MANDLSLINSVFGLCSEIIEEGPTYH